MRPDEPDKQDAGVVAHGDDQSIVIALNVEHDPVVGQETGGTVHGLDVGRRMPVGPPGLGIPAAQGRFRRWMGGPKRA
ncbi:MAG: hypothetical protein QG599_1441 [Pseudomonadota bacterium]|nr:hypothetical protein [Pseudomonadota bacterium]